MKKRLGFVSNSSSSSFICNTKMTPEEVRDKLVVLLDFYNNFYDEDLVFENVFDEPFIAEKDYRVANSEGSVIVEGAYDNSIPYDIFDMIESKFNATRCHFG